ncbi:TIR domain-containing protein [Sphingopyxis sp.]|uniref:TIR domain-containing protein n=1 Tax=Sphingopyxis sp. TaxID=1908224 RepID=UPI003D1194C4
MTDVFISYKREERGRCVAIYNALVDLKLSVWFDAHIEPGTDFDREIEREVRGAKAVLVLWSALAADSDWIRAEARTGRQNERLVAIRLDDCLPPLEFASVQAVDLFDRRDFQSDEGWRQIVARIGRLTGRPGLGDYVRCEQDADAGRWRGWIAANPDDPLVDKAKQRLALLMRPDPAPSTPQPIAPAVDVPPPMISTPARTPAESATPPWLTWMRHHGWIAAIALLVLLGAIVLFDRFAASDTTQVAAIDGAPSESASTPNTVPTTTVVAGQDRPGRCPGTNPFRIAASAGRTDPQPEWNPTVDSAWLAWKNCPGLVVVEGHVEQGGDTRDASRMAIAVAEQLVQKGIPEGTLTWTGKGATTPLAGHGPTDAANRRIEIYLMEPYHPGLR